MKSLLNYMCWYCLGGATFGGPQWLFVIAVACSLAHLVILVLE